MHSRTAVFAIIVGMVLYAIPITHAQDENSASKQSEPKEEVKSAAKPSQRQATAYRFDFSINELEDGKKLNTRKYSMNLSDYSGGGQDLKIGTRVSCKASLFPRSLNNSERISQTLDRPGDSGRYCGHHWLRISGRSHQKRPSTPASNAYCRQHNPCPE